MVIICRRRIETRDSHWFRCRQLQYTSCSCVIRAQPIFVVGSYSKLWVFDFDLASNQLGIHVIWD